MEHSLAVISQPSMHSKIQHMEFDLLLTTNELKTLRHNLFVYVLLEQVEKFVNSEWQPSLTDEEIREKLKAYLIRYSNSNQQFQKNRNHLNCKLFQARQLRFAFIYRTGDYHG